MLVPITISISSSSTSPLPPPLVKLGHDELVLIELQGSLDIECSDNSDRDGQMVGKFRLDEGSSKPTLTIGHHLLEGKIVSLPKPLGVMQRSAHTSPNTRKDHEMDDDDDMALGDIAVPSNTAQSTKWDVVAIVKKKIVFSKRPMPIVGSTAAPTSKKG